MLFRLLVSYSYWTRNGLYGYNTRYGYHHEHSCVEVFKDLLDDVNREYLSRDSREAQVDWLIDCWLIDRVWLAPILLISVDMTGLGGHTNISISAYPDIYTTLYNPTHNLLFYVLLIYPRPRPIGATDRSWHQYRDKKRSEQCDVWSELYHCGEKDRRGDQSCFS